MSRDGEPAAGTRMVLLSLLAWLRRRGLVREVYRRIPIALRARVASALTRRATKRLMFKRTRRWDMGAQSAAAENSADVHCAPSQGGGPGVNVMAYARGQFGVGESARLYTRALLGREYPLVVNDIPLEGAHSMHDSSLRALIRSESPYPVNLLFVNPDSMDAAEAALGAPRLRGRYTIACWHWELETFPAEWVPYLARVDEILVSSTFVAEAVGRVTDKPILKIPLPITAIADSGLQRADFGLMENVFVFLASFDFNSFIARKNPMAAAAAFQKAFPKGRRDVQFLIKTSNGFRHPHLLRMLLDAVADDPRIIVRDDVIDRCHIQALQRCVDAYVSLHRSEGFGLGLAECMYLGKPVIATGWSGNMEFMTADNSCLVKYDLIPVEPGEYIHGAGQRWADPDIDCAARFMRRLANEPDYAEEIGHRAARHVRVVLSADVVADQLVAHFDALHVPGRASTH